jgi:tRNA(Arg) A34 adenosine deaminase TadA
MRQRHGAACLTYKGSIVYGWNWRAEGKLNPHTARKLGYHDYSIHAEVAAVMEAIACGEHPKEVLVIRRMRSGLFGLSRPCGACMGVLEWAGVRRVYYSSGPNTIEEVHLTREVKK